MPLDFLKEERQEVLYLSPHDGHSQRGSPSELTTTLTYPASGEGVGFGASAIKDPAVVIKLAQSSPFLTDVEMVNKMELDEVASQFYHLNAQVFVSGSSLVGRVRKSMRVKWTAMLFGRGSILGQSKLSSLRETVPKYQTPFSLKIKGVVPSKKFTPPKFTLYDGKSDP
ncbi:hypothetical protein Acr_28g0006910 [Actinidia rufa]|uniref:Uncharacterized protein n=1 Tax=Actinidia rufa TaxID=165716 RepID=A0A7J0HA81_9ERIC|nr:hypothetical protein Acr_28g0006910 [Actinidia rufa]